MKFKVSQDCDYVKGHLRYGHFEGIIEADSLEEAKKLLDEEDCMDLVVDDYVVDDYDLGNNEIQIEEIKE